MSTLKLFLPFPVPLYALQCERLCTSALACPFPCSVNRPLRKALKTSQASKISRVISNLAHLLREKTDFDTFFPSMLGTMVGTYMSH